MVPINYLAVLLCAVLSMILGTLWYGPLFGKPWMKMMGLTTADMEAAKKKGFVASGMAQSYGLMFVGSLACFFVLAHALVFAAAYLKIDGLSAGLQAGFWNWFGFLAPLSLGSVLWEKKPWKLWILNNAYQLVNLLIGGAVLALWK